MCYNGVVWLSKVCYNVFIADSVYYNMFCIADMLQTVFGLGMSVLTTSPTWLSVIYGFHSTILSPTYRDTVYSGLETVSGTFLSRTS